MQKNEICRKGYDMGAAIILFFEEMVSLTVLFVLGKLMRPLLNSKKPPYIVRNVYDPSMISVFVYRVQKLGSRHVEYKFRNENGSWKPVPDKRNIIGGIIGALIMSVIMICLVGFIEFIIMAFPVALFVGALFASRYHEAYRILMKN